MEPSAGDRVGRHPSATMQLRLGQPPAARGSICGAMGHSAGEGIVVHAETSCRARDDVTPPPPPRTTWEVSPRRDFFVLFVLLLCFVCFISCAPDLWPGCCSGVMFIGEKHAFLNTSNCLFVNVRAGQESSLLEVETRPSCLAPASREVDEQQRCRGAPFACRNWPMKLGNEEMSAESLPEKGSRQTALFFLLGWRGAA